MGKETKRVRKDPDAAEKALPEYCMEIVKRFKPACIVLYGSRAKGTFTGISDIDIIVISSNFEQDFLSRIKDLIDANTSSLPIEPLGYTEAEFETMLVAFRLTALDAVHEGIPLYGEDYFNSLKKRLNELERMGLYKDNASWHIPAKALG
ncbi:Nucleotidyltransferase domain protein [uncultured archaeon]|nr:Nucleotidyltransferase domain protein [uncultured archaeon]